MINKIDTGNLEKQINLLEGLRKDWMNRKVKLPDIGNCGGGTVEQLGETTTALQAMQDSFVLLVDNTIAYMRQRKESVEVKEEKAAATVKNN